MSDEDFAILQRGVVGRGNGKDTYVLSNTFIQANSKITLSDQGTNDLHLIDGLEILSSKVTENALHLTLSNNAEVTILGADSYEFYVGGNPLTGFVGVQYSFTTFASDFLSVDIPTSGIATGGQASVGQPNGGSDVNDIMDAVVVQAGVLGKGEGHDTYMFSDEWLRPESDIIISDSGDNTVQFMDGFNVSSSLVAKDAILINTKDGSKITILDASNDEYVVGGNPLKGEAGDLYDFAGFVTLLGVDVPDAEAINRGLQTTISSQTSWPSDERRLVLETEIYSGVAVDLKNYHFNPSVSSLLGADVNSDGLTDLLFHLWWDVNSNKEVVINDPTPDLLVAYTQNSDGSFTHANKDVFGELYPSLGGASGKVDHSDINADGIIDFAFNMHMEDQRATIGVADTNAAYPALLLSNDSDGYDVIHLGMPSWGHGVNFLQTSSSSFDVLFSGTTPPNQQAFRYTADGFEEVTQYYIETLGFWNNIETFYSNTEQVAFVASTFGNSIYDEDGIVQQIELGFKVNILGETYSNEVFIGSYLSDILMSSSFSPDVANVFVTTSLWENSVAYLNIDDQGIYQEAGGRIVLANNFRGAMLSDDASAKAGAVLLENDLIPFSSFNFFELTADGVTEINVNFVNEVLNVNSNFFDILDLNMDGNFDLVVHVLVRTNEPTADTQNLPVIYLNDGSDSLVNTHASEVFDISKLNLSESVAGTQTELIDLNNDGWFELVQFPEVLRSDEDILIASNLLTLH